MTKFLSTYNIEHKVIYPVDFKMLSKKMSSVLNFYLKTWSIETLNLKDMLLVVSSNNKNYVIYIQDIYTAYNLKQDGLLKSGSFDRYFLQISRKIEKPYKK